MKRGSGEVVKPFGWEVRVEARESDGEKAPGVVVFVDVAAAVLGAVVAIRLHLVGDSEDQPW